MKRQLYDEVCTECKTVRMYTFKTLCKLFNKVLDSEHRGIKWSDDWTDEPFYKEKRDFNKKCYNGRGVILVGGQFDVDEHRVSSEWTNSIVGRYILKEFNYPS